MVGELQPAGLVEAALELARLRPQLSGRMVGDPGHQPRCGRVLDFDRDGFLLSERQGFRHPALNAVARAAWQKREVARRDDHEAEVIDHGDNGEHRRHDRESDQGRTDAHCPEQLRLRCETP